MNYSIEVATTTEDLFHNITVWLSDNNDPSHPNDKLKLAPLYLTYAATCYKHSILEKLLDLKGNVDELCSELLIEFNEDFEMVTRNLHIFTDVDTVLKMLQLVEEFICNYVHSLNDAPLSNSAIKGKTVSNI